MHVQAIVTGHGRLGRQSKVGDGLVHHVPMGKGEACLVAAVMESTEGKHCLGLI